MLVSFAASAAQSPAPALPTIALDTFPPSARASVAAAQKKAETWPGDPAAVGEYARMLHAWEQWDAAHRAYGRAQALAPAAFEWFYLDAIVLQRLARHGEAAERLERAVARRASYLPARIKLAEARYEAGDLSGSQPLFEKLLTEPAAEPAAELGLGRIAAAQGRHEIAIGHFERAIALFPEFGAAHYALARSYRTLGRAGDARRALAEHAKHGARWPGVEDPLVASVAGLREDARALLAKGVASVAAGEVREAIRLHEAALERDRSLVQVHANLLSLYGRIQDWKKAEEHYRAALAAGVATADVYYDYGVVQGMQQSWEAAAGAYRRAIEINPLHANAHNNLGQLLELQRRFEEAAEHYRKAVAAQPSFRLGRFNLGRMLLALNRPEQAVVEFEQLQRPVDAETPRYVFALSTAYVRAGRVTEGIELANAARRLAIEQGQTELADAIGRELSKLK
jgi:tetratricopeptide (TPR) repeat protein